MKLIFTLFVTIAQHELLIAIPEEYTGRSNFLQKQPISAAIISPAPQALIHPPQAGRLGQRPANAGPPAGVPGAQTTTAPTTTTARPTPTTTTPRPTPTTTRPTPTTTRPTPTTTRPTSTTTRPTPTTTTTRLPGAAGAPGKPAAPGDRAAPGSPGGPPRGVGRLVAPGAAAPGQ